MLASGPSHAHIAPSTASAAAVATLLAFECDLDRPLVSLPGPEASIVVRLGGAAPGGLDAYAFGGRANTHRKVIRRGQRTVTARFRLGIPDAVLGAPAAALAGRIVPLEALWGSAGARRLLERISATRGTTDAARILDGAIAERLALADGRRSTPRLAIEAAERLASASVNAVADDLGVSERHLRRVFREAVGVSPKAFAKVRRFQRALQAARAGGSVSWASIAAAAGYYDQAHLIAEFRAIAGVTPRALLGELQGLPEIG